MKILAIETATEACSAALNIDGEVTQKYSLAPQRHANLILSYVESLLAESGYRISDMDALALGHGPGSFTGVRVAAGVAQGLALGSGLPLVPVSSLHATALGFYEQNKTNGSSMVIVAFDARMSEVYTGGFDFGLKPLGELCWEERVIGPQSIRTGELPDAAFVGVGSGFGSYGDLLKSTLGKNLGSCFPECFPHASAVSTLAAQAFAQGLQVLPEDLQPSYLRQKVAQKPKALNGVM